MSLPSLFASVVVLLSSSPVSADMWCAHPIWVHEWGVHVLGPGAPAPLPDWFYRGGPAVRTGAVRELPPDSGVRALPVLHFYAAGTPTATIPIGIEVGFSGGPASAWFPQVDRRVDAAVANGPAAHAARVELEVLRAMRKQYQRRDEPVPPDPTRQLVWDRLELGAKPGPTNASDLAWVKRARAIDDALWVSGPGDSERFVFYEADTHETNPLTVKRANGWDPEHRAYTLTNGSTSPIHDVIVSQRERGATYVVTLPLVGAHESVRFVLDEHRADDTTAERMLRASLTDTATRAAKNECVGDRDPAVPFEHSQGYRLYPGEIDTLLGAWRERFFAAPGTTIVYREDEAAIDAAVPLSLYTDMYTYVLLNRASLALWEGVSLP